MYVSLESRSDKENNMKKSIATATFPINALMDAYNYDTEEECKEYLLRLKKMG